MLCASVVPKTGCDSFRSTDALEVGSARAHARGSSTSWALTEDGETHGGFPSGSPGRRTDGERSAMERVEA